MLRVCCRLPDGFTQLRNLTHLGLNDVSLARLPPDIGRSVHTPSPPSPLMLYIVAVYLVGYPALRLNSASHHGFVF